MQNFRNEKKSNPGKGLPYTHLMTDAPFGSYNIPENMYAKFIKLYENAIVDGYEPHITEKHKEYGPIVIDFDFVQSKEHNKRYYTDTTITNSIRLYNTLIKKYLDIPNKYIDAYVCEKKKPVLSNGDYHDGIHIVYPYICTKPSLQMVMRAEFIKIAEENGIFKKIPVKKDHTLEKIFDKNVIYSNPWMLYGSKKKKSSEAYKVTHIFQSANGKIFDVLIPGENIKTRSYIRHFIDVLSCRRFFSEKDITSLAPTVDPIEIDAKINKIKEKLNDKKVNEKTKEKK